MATFTVKIVDRRTGEIFENSNVSASELGMLDALARFFDSDVEVWMPSSDSPDEWYQVH